MICNLKGLFTLKTLWICANITATAFLTAQLVHVLDGFFKPSITRTWEEEVLLKNMDFPLVAKICIIPGFNQTALYDVGYDGTVNYFIGQSRFNHSLIGWAGHTEDYGIVGSVEEILERVSNNKIGSIVNAVSLWIPESPLGWNDIPLEKLKVAPLKS